MCMCVQCHQCVLHDWQAHQQASADANRVQQSASADMSALIPEYRATLGRMKGQVDEMRQRLENACEDRHTLQQQVSPCDKL